MAESASRQPTPEETADAYKQLKTQADLEVMLGEVEKLKGGRDILGPDGKTVRTPAEQEAALRSQVDQYRRQKISELSARLESLAQRSSTFASCMSLLREANCLINLAYSEMSTIEGVDDELIGFAGEFMQHAVRNDTNDQLEELIRRIKRNVLTFLNRKKFQYEKLVQRRKPALLKLAKLNFGGPPVIMTDNLRDLGVSVPCFNLGMVYVFFAGEFADSEEAALKVFARLKEKDHSAIFLGTKIGVPRSWWQGACDTEDALSKVLDPALEHAPDMSLLTVSSLDFMLGEEKRADTSPKSRQQALLRIVRWCLDNLVIGLVFSEGSAQDRPWLGRAMTLKKGADNGVDRGGVSDGTQPEILGPDSGGGGQAPEGHGKDQG